MKIKMTKTIRLTFLTLLFVGGCVLAAGVFAYVFRDNADELVNAVELVATKEAEEQGKIRVSNLFLESQEERRELKQFVLTEDRLIDFVSEIEMIAGQQQVVFETKRIDDISKKGEKFGEYLLDVEFAGEQIAVRKMIEIFENLPYHGSVQAVTLMEQGGEWRALITLHLTVVSYD